MARLKPSCEATVARRWNFSIVHRVAMGLTLVHRLATVATEWALKTEGTSTADKTHPAAGPAAIHRPN